MLRRLVFALLLCCLAAVPVRAGDVVLATLEWEPYIGSQMVENGYVAAIAREAFGHSGIDPLIVFMPWKRSVEMVRRGRYHGLIPEYYAPEREKDFVFSDPFPGGPLVVFRARGSDLELPSLEALRGHLVGVVRGYINSRDFDAAEWIERDEAADDLTNLRKLFAERIDFAVMDEYVGRHLAKTHFGDEDAVEVALVLERKDLYVAFPRVRPDHEELARAFNDGLAHLRETGRLRQILGRHGFDLEAGSRP